MASKEYYCTLRPLGEYFLGGERTFRFDDMVKEEQDGKIDYYIISEDRPTQTTLLGMLRFLALQKARLLSDSYKDTSKVEQQKNLVGPRGFLVLAGENEKRADYGVIEEVGPLFLTKGGHRLIPTPLDMTLRDKKELEKLEKEEKNDTKENQEVKTLTYRPFQEMTRCFTEFGEDSFLPSAEDYEAKQGLPNSFTDIDGNLSVVERDDIFCEREHTRIKKLSKEEGFFKKVYKQMDPAYAFGFYCRAREGALPENAVVYVGQDKSVFSFSLQAVKDGEGSENFLKRIGDMVERRQDVAVFYAASDVFVDVDEKMQKMLLYCVVQRRPFRNMLAGETRNCYRDSMRKSEPYQLVRAGSVFYVRPEASTEFEQLTKAQWARQIGMNTMVKMGGK